MDRISVRLSDHEFTDLDALGGKNRTDNVKLAIKLAKKYNKHIGKKNGKKKRTNTDHKTEEKN
tara:strand:- start:643 stop:831 length:189 start_codon:yes stop_codon:yes gene_type:complete